MFHPFNFSGRPSTCNNNNNNRVEPNCQITAKLHQINFQFPEKRDANANFNLLTSKILLSLNVQNSVIS